MGEEQGNYGVSNLELARIASKSGLPVIAQWEVSRLMSLEFSKSALRSIELEKNGMKYLDSYNVLLKAKLYMRQQGFTEAVLMGHQDHLPRVKMIAKKLEIKLSKKSVLHPDIPYDPHSIQWWTRNKFYFWLREIPVYILMFLKGQM